nr:stAR-related lipid transfer protein 13-like [Oncorhynchus nerka]
MSQLMRKLDQLNLDIEEALSASSSPSDTPCTARRQQYGAVSGTAVNQSLNEEDSTLLQRGEPDTDECLRQDQHKTLAPSSSAEGTRARTKKTVMCSKMTNAGAELEAKEACDWLRAAGFPQYAQLFEDSQVPIDISPVKKDHDFLDNDLVEPLYSSDTSSLHTGHGAERNTSSLHTGHGAERNTSSLHTGHGNRSVCQCLDQVGLFRKSGVKSRIQALRQMNESSPDDVSYEDQSAYDVADMVKQFFRDLPEPLLTSKLGETFLHIYQYVPKDQRLQAVQAAIMLMSDENREVLQMLLCFLSDVTSSVEENQMTPMNIAVCLAPSLFHLNILKKDNLSPRAMQRKYTTGRPDQKDLNENLSATQGLAHMIIECNRLFEIPHEMVTQSRNSYAEADLHAPTLEELCRQQEEDDASYQAEARPCQTHSETRPQNLYQSYVESRLQELLKEAREKAKGWVSCTSSDNTELYCKKVGDGNPLRRWRVAVEVEAPPSVVLNRVLRERHLWDVDLLQWKVAETLDRHAEVFHYVLNRMPPHPSRDFLVLRSWRTELPKGTCALVCVSVEHEDCPRVGGVRAVVLESNYLLEPCGSGKSRLTHICRVDFKGRSPEWYNKAFGHLCAAEVARIRNSFQPISTEGPETKI